MIHKAEITSIHHIGGLREISSSRTNIAKNMRSRISALQKCLTFGSRTRFPGWIRIGSKYIEETYPSALEELILSSLNVLLLSSPCSQDGSLQSATVWEGQSPWSLWYVVDGVQIDWSFFFWLTSGQECDSWRIKKLNELLSQNKVYQVNSPGTAAGTVRRKAVTVASAICSAVGRVPLYPIPAVHMFGFNKVPSK